MPEVGAKFKSRQQSTKEPCLAPSIKTPVSVSLLLPPRKNKTGQNELPERTNEQESRQRTVRTQNLKAVKVDSLSAISPLTDQFWVEYKFEKPSVLRDNKRVDRNSWRSSIQHTYLIFTVRAGLMYLTRSVSSGAQTNRFDAATFCAARKSHVPAAVRQTIISNP